MDHVAFVLYNIFFKSRSNMLKVFKRHLILFSFASRNHSRRFYPRNEKASFPTPCINLSVSCITLLLVQVRVIIPLRNLIYHDIKIGLLC